MGDTLPLKQEGACLGRSVTSWTSDSGSSPACSTARRWRRSATSSGSRGRPATRSYERYKDCGVQGLTDRSRRPYRHANQLPMAVEEGHRPAEEGVSRAGARRRSASGCGGAGRSACPAISTVHAVLDRHGLVRRRRRRRTRRRRARRCRGRPTPNALWCADYKGEFMLGNRRLLLSADDHRLREPLSARL